MSFANFWDSIKTCVLSCSIKTCVYLVLLKLVFYRRILRFRLLFLNPRICFALLNKSSTLRFRIWIYLFLDYWSMDSYIVCSELFLNSLFSNFGRNKAVAENMYNDMFVNPDYLASFPLDFIFLNNSFVSQNCAISHTLSQVRYFCPKNG